MGPTEFGSRLIPLHELECLERWRHSNGVLLLQVDRKRTNHSNPSPASKEEDLPLLLPRWKRSHFRVGKASRAKPAPARSSRIKKFRTVAVSQTLENSDQDMTGVVKTEYSSPRKGKENKNISNHIPVPSITLTKNAKNEAKSSDTTTPKKEKVDGNKAAVSLTTNKKLVEKKSIGKSEAAPERKAEENGSNDPATSNRTVRPQTKILRRPTPNLKHPVIQVDSGDDSGADSSSSDKMKDDNPKRLKMGPENHPSDSSSHNGKRKNFIMYNKYNVDKNTKKAERTSANPMSSSSIPNPCTSCNRSQAPERLHSHARKDARGLMNNRRSPAMDVKMTSPQKKPPDPSTAPGKAKTKEVLVKSGPSSPSCSKQEDSSREKMNGVGSENSTTAGDSRCATGDGSEEPPKEFVEPCYICQKEFKVSELLLHESKCLETWKKTNNSLTPNLRQLPPRRPADVSCPLLVCHEEDDRLWSAVQSQLIPCPLCCRTFFPERLPVHRRVCKGKQSPRPLRRASSLREQSTESEDPKPAPLYLPCYICGRNYGSWVLPMHEQQCLKKWRTENEKLSEEERQEEPKKTNGLVTDDDVASLIELGDNAWESHLQQLVPCPRCSRTFFPDRLEIHQRSCKGPSRNRRPRSYKGL